MELKIQLEKAGCADGVYSVTGARGYTAAALKWADEQGIFQDWTTMACIPLDADGNGRVELNGGRAVPAFAVRAAAELTNADGMQSAVLYADLPDQSKNTEIGEAIRFVVMSDLHLSSKAGHIRRAFRLAQEADCVLLAGDLTNDGKPDQLERFKWLIEEELEGIPVLAVAGNHDYPLYPLPLIRSDEIDCWDDMQHWLIERARSMGVRCEETACGACRAWVKGIEIIGLKAVSHWRRFVFPRGEQLVQLERWLHEKKDVHKRVVMCHAPLLAHNPQRVKGRDAAYLSRDEQLQNILDAAGNVIFVSGHTHISLNDADGCVEQDHLTGNIYINDSSVTATMFKGQHPAADGEWTDGAVIHMNMAEDCIELKAQNISSQKYISRGYYRL